MTISPRPRRKSGEEEGVRRSRAEEAGEISAGVSERVRRNEGRPSGPTSPFMPAASAAAAAPRGAPKALMTARLRSIHAISCVREMCGDLVRSIVPDDIAIARTNDTAPPSRNPPRPAPVLLPPLDWVPPFPAAGAPQGSSRRTTAITMEKKKVLMSVHSTLSTHSTQYTVHSTTLW